MTAVDSATAIRDYVVQSDKEGRKALLQNM